MGLEEDSSHSTDLTLSRNPLKTTGTGANSKDSNNLSQPLSHGQGLRYNEDDLIIICLQFPVEATPILLEAGQLDVPSLHSLAHSSTLRLSSGYWSPEMRNQVIPCIKSDLSLPSGQLMTPAPISISSPPCLQTSVSAAASCLWDPELETHYEDLIISDIMETEDRDREEHDVLAL